MATATETIVAQCPNKANGWRDCHEVQALVNKDVPLCPKCQHEATH